MICFAFKYDTRLLQFKIYYELGYFEEAFALIDTHKHFISNNKTVSDYYREMHTNFLDFYSRLLKMKEGGIIKDAGLLNKEITKVNNVLAKAWLNEKTKELIQLQPKFY